MATHTMRSGDVRNADVKGPIERLNCSSKSQHGADIRRARSNRFSNRSPIHRCSEPTADIMLVFGRKRVRSAIATPVSTGIVHLACCNLGCCNTRSTRSAPGATTGGAHGWRSLQCCRIGLRVFGRGVRMRRVACALVLRHSLPSICNRVLSHCGGVSHRWSFLKRHACVRNQGRLVLRSNDLQLATIGLLCAIAWCR